MKTIISIVLSLLTIKSLHAQQTPPPFYSDIQFFKTQDSAHFPGTGKILFVGSSSFTKWTDVQNYFPAYPIINRGFGGSSIPDIIRYAGDIIFPYQPKQVIIYCGENDFAGSDTVTVDMVIGRFIQLFTLIRNKFPQVHICYISMKPSPSRMHLVPKFITANTAIENYLKEQQATCYIDVFHAMLDQDNQPLKDIFIEDNLHMNAKGYAIWQKLIEPILLK